LRNQLVLDIGDLPPAIQQTYFESHSYADILIHQYAEQTRTLNEEERTATRASLVRHFAEIASTVVPEIRFCRTVAKLAATEAVLKLFDDPNEHKQLVQAVEELSKRTARHEAAFRLAVYAIDGLTPPESEPDVELVAPLPP
jgi:hypothetical protein